MANSEFDPKYVERASAHPPLTLGSDAATYPPSPSSRSALLPPAGMFCVMCYAEDPLTRRYAHFIACGHSVCPEHVNEVIEAGA